MTPGAGDRLLHAGRVGRPHGLDGSFYVTRPTAMLLAVGVPVTVAGTAREVDRRAGTDARPILRLRGVADRAAAESLREADLLVARAAAPALAENEYWPEDLEGCAVVAGDRVLGTVARMLSYPSCELLEVGDLLVPLVGDAIVAVDLGARRIEVDPGFLGI